MAYLCELWNYAVYWRCDKAVGQNFLISFKVFNAHANNF